MATLAIDTSTPSPSLALVGLDVSLERTLEPAVGAGRRVALEIHELLLAAGATVSDVDRIVVGVGPGGFTGLRIGIATALGLGQALDVPVAGVASIEALGLGIARASGGRLAVPVIDAKRQEVFAAAYKLDGDVLVEIAPPQALGVEGAREFLDGLDAPAVVAGDGVERIRPLVGGQVSPLGADHPAHRVSALALEERSRTGGSRPVTPLYLRLPDAEVNRLRRERTGRDG